MIPNRMGLGMRPPMGGPQGYGPPGQGPPLSALSSQMPYPGAQLAQPAGPKLTAFVGSISPGISDAFLVQLLAACGPLRSFKRSPTATGKPGAFGFAEFDQPDAISRALKLLDGLLLPCLEEGAGPAKALRLTADAKTKTLLEAYDSQKMETEADTNTTNETQSRIEALVKTLTNGEGTGNGDEDGQGSAYVVPAHLKDLQEADLPENQRGIVLSEIAQFRERAMKKEKDKMEKERGSLAFRSGPRDSGHAASGGHPPSGPAQGPRERVWGKPNGSGSQMPSQGWSGSPGASKGNGFVKAAAETSPPGPSAELEKTDEDLERERRLARERQEDNSFRDRERRYEPRERQRISAIERTLARERVVKESEERDREAIKGSLEAWDDDESDELFYVERSKWRARRAHALASEIAQDAASRKLELREAEHLRIESERFLARQMDDLRSLAEEQRKAGLLLVGDDAGPLRLNMSMGVGESTSTAQPNGPSASGTPAAPVEKRVAPQVFGDADEEDEDFGRKRRKGLVKLDFGLADGVEANKERLNRLKEGISKDKDVLFKFKVRWEALNDHLIDTKFESLTKRKMKEYLGELDDDLIMFVVEHLKDHKGPQKLIEGLEPVLMEEAVDFVTLLWRQVVFESVTYAEGLETEGIMLS